MHKKLIVNTDGGARGNPGPAGIGVVIKNEAEEIIYEYSGFIGHATNNVAEYKALLRALEEAHRLGADSLEVRMDSELIVKQMRGEYKIKEPTLQTLAQEAVRLLRNFSIYNFVHVRREYNKAADRLVNEAIDGAL